VYGRDVYFGRGLGILQAYPIPTVIAPRLVYDSYLALELECDAVILEPLSLNVRDPRHIAKQFEKRPQYEPSARDFKAAERTIRTANRVRRHDG
jgi:hypothetical protein